MPKLSDIMAKSTRPSLADIEAGRYVPTAEEEAEWRKLAAEFWANITAAAKRAEAYRRGEA